MRKPKDYKPIEYRQLYMIAKMLLQQEPTMDDAEWKARTLSHLEHLGFDNPPTGMLGRAMSAAEANLAKTVGPRTTRGIPLPLNTPVEPTVETPKEARTHRPAGWDLVVSLMAKLNRSASSAASLPQRPDGPSALLEISEEQAINEFWQQARDGADRLSLLKSFAEVGIVRPSGWDVLEIRRNAPNHTLSAADGCFVCRSEHCSWHHVIQIQHGGSNYLRNRVPLCDACHALVHPWLPPAPRRVRGGFTRLGESAEYAIAEIEHIAKQGKRRA